MENSTRMERPCVQYLISMDAVNALGQYALYCKWNPLCGQMKVPDCDWTHGCECHEKVMGRTRVQNEQGDSVLRPLLS